MCKKLSFVLVLCIILSSLTFNVSAVGSIGSMDMDTEVSNPNTSSYVENEIVLLTNYYVNLEDFVGTAPFDFHDVPITAIQPLFEEMTAEEIAECPIFPYVITITSGIDVLDAIDVLNASEGIIASEPNYYVKIDTPTQTSLIDNSTNSINEQELNWAYNYLDITLAEIMALEVAKTQKLRFWKQDIHSM